MGASLKLGRIAGIGVHLHWTFLILVAWIFAAYLLGGEGWQAGLVGVVFICALFACIVLHELGHALTAKRFGVETRDITLLPIGGIARLQRMPDRPMQEFVVAIAGPIVTAVIAGVLALVLWPIVGTEGLRPGPLAGGKFFVNLMWVNVLLLVFNLIPAFPMDGGRMLRSLLAVKLDYGRATQIAAGLGQLLAVMFAFLALLPPLISPDFGINIFLLFIALFVFLGAAGESRLAQVRTLLQDVPVRDAMITQFRSLAPDDPVQRAADELLAGWQTDFPVIEGDRYRGMVRRDDIAAAFREGRGDVEVSQMMVQECPSVSDRDMLYRVMERMQTGHCSALPVTQNGSLVGLITTENIGELILLRSATKGAALRGRDVVDAAWNKPRADRSVTNK